MNSDHQDEIPNDLDEKLENATFELIRAARDLLLYEPVGGRRWAILRWLRDEWDRNCPYHPGEHSKGSGLCPGKPRETREEEDVKF